MLSISGINEIIHFQLDGVNFSRLKPFIIPLRSLPVLLFLFRGLPEIAAHCLIRLTFDKFLIPYKVSARRASGYSDNGFVNAFIAENMTTGSRTGSHQHFQAYGTAKLASRPAVLLKIFLSLSEEAFKI